ncbi:MAG: hypothetical protein ACFFCY_04985 [Promethearchaeota archaeon]
MSEIEINGTPRLIETKWFGIRLNQTAKIILFFLALIRSIGGTNILLSINSLILLIQYYGFAYEMVVAQIFYNIIRIIILVISIYTLYICVKSRNERSETKNNMNPNSPVINLFGFKLSQTSAIIIFFLALLGIPSIISSIYSYIYNLRYIIQSLLYSGVDWYNMVNLIAYNYLLSTLIFELVIYIYSIVRFSQLRKSFER